jgi:hypothetical protein
VVDFSTLALWHYLALQRKKRYGSFFLQHFADRDVTVVVDDAPELRAWLQAAGAPAVLVRQDRYLLGARPARCRS